MPGLIDKIFGSAASGIADTAANIVDKFVLTGQEKFDAAQKEQEQEWRFKEYEADNAQKELNRNLEYYKSDAADRLSARDYAKTELTSGDKFVSHFRYWFAAGICLFILALLAVMLFNKVPPENNNVVMYVLGVLSTTFSTIVAFYFGSSSGSSLKDSVIQDQAKQLNK